MDTMLRLPSMGPFVLGGVRSWDCDAVLDEPTVSGTSSPAATSRDGRHMSSRNSWPARQVDRERDISASHILTPNNYA